MNNKEDQTAPISEQTILEISKQCSYDAKKPIINQLVGYLCEKRDAYNGIVSSMIYVIDSQDQQFNDLLENKLIDLIVSSNPMSYGGKVFLTTTLHRLTQERPRFVARLFLKLIEDSAQWSKNGYNECEIIRLKITALRAIRQSEQKARATLTNLTNDEIDQLCDNAMAICDNATKVDTLHLVLDTKITTKILTDRELRIFKDTFADALSFHEPSLRQSFLAVTNKLIKRIVDSHRVIAREKSKYGDSFTIITDRYMGFLKWSIRFCLDSIYCNAYFGSFILTISTLLRIIEHVTFSNSNLPILDCFDSKRCYDSILSCLNDSFEDNKALALELLLQLPNNNLFINHQNLRALENIAYYLVSSINPAHSLTCQYVFRLIIGIEFKISQIQDRGYHRNDVVFKHLSNLISLVEEGVHETQENFAIALRNKPIYPKLTCIRAILNEVEISELHSKRNQWEQLTRRLVNISIGACRAVSTVVCNLNPETIGHLPMDQRPLDIESISKSLNVSLKITNEQLHKITSQMLLISGWKTIKECSLTMGTLCTRFWWPSQRIKHKLEKFPGFDYLPVLDSDQIKKIIGFFDHYLRNLRHRGAFEQAYNGFIMVTKRVWHQPEFREILLSTLRDIISEFKNENVIDRKKVEYLKAYVTRRSAGLPFIVQAIVCSEFRNETETLDEVMKSLFSVLENPNSETYQHIHCLNILRALIKEHQLGEKVSPYIGKTIEISMDSFKSNSFPIRNCANMLLKAAIDRTFGVNRLRDDIHKRNKLSFEKFFTEYPNLHSKMLDQLEDGLENKQSLASVHSVFIILFRLKPSLNPSAPYTSDRIIEPFIGPIWKLTLTCPDLKIRELAAKLVAQLQNYHDASTMDYYFLEKRAKELELLIYSDVSLKTGNLNHLHGTLLLLQNWIKSISFTREESIKSSNGASCLFKFALKLVEDVLCYRTSKMEHFLWNFIEATALDIIEIDYIFKTNVSDENFRSRVLWDRLSHARSCEASYAQESTATKPPYFEQNYFKLITLIMKNCPPPYDEKRQRLCQDDGTIAQTISFMDQIVELVCSENSATSLGFRAALVRLMRQLCVERVDSFLYKLLHNIDLDLLANFATPFDKFDSLQNDEHEYIFWADYCKTERLSEFIDRDPNHMHSIILKLFDCPEFHPPEGHRHITKSSNTPRSIEILALACQWWPILSGKIEPLAHRLPLDSVVDMIDSLPDCDTKCLALLFCAESFGINLRMGLDINDKFTESLEELANGYHGYIMRETCIEALKRVLFELVSDRIRIACRVSLLNTLSALIKLCQDEDNDIRQKSYQVVADLRARLGSTSECTRPNEESNGGRLNELVKLLTNNVFNPTYLEDVLDCLDLCLRMIFNHSRDYPMDFKEGRDQLFDKTKLNSFADHVATIQAVLINLGPFMRRKASHQTVLSLEDLKISTEIRLQLDCVEEANQSCTGDYGHRSMVGVRRSNPEPSESNQVFVDRILLNSLASLDYFSENYWNMLTDTDYTHHELSLFKRLAFIRLIIDYTDYKPFDSTIVDKIRNKLIGLLQNSSATTMLCKCLEFIN